MKWSVRVGRGWRKIEKPPREVEEVAEMHKEGKEGILCQHCDSHVRGFEGLGECPFYEGAHSEMRSGGGALRVVCQFLQNLHKPDTDVASLIFINFKPSEFSLSPRPSGGFGDARDLQEGLQVFLESVVGSIDSFGNPDSMWSLCDWAMLTCTKTP